MHGRRVRSSRSEPFSRGGVWASSPAASWDQPIAFSQPSHPPAPITHSKKLGRHNYRRPRKHFCPSPLPMFPVRNPCRIRRQGWPPPLCPPRSPHSPLCVFGVVDPVRCPRPGGADKAGRRRMDASQPLPAARVHPPRGWGSERVWECPPPPPLYAGPSPSRLLIPDNADDVFSDCNPKAGPLVLVNMNL